MRRAEVAGGHAAGLLHHGPLSRPDRAGTFAGYIAKGAAERAETGPAGLERDLGDGQVRVAEQRRGPLEPAREQVAVRRHAEGLLERAREVRLGHAAHARQPPNGPLFVRGGIHPILGAQQAAQQSRVLVHWQSLTPAQVHRSKD